MTLFSMARPVLFKVPHAPALPISEETLRQGYEAR
jgi:hypothetical protein